MSRSPVAALATFAVLTACGGGGPAVPGRAVPSAASFSDLAKAPFLYVAGGNGSGTVSQYALGESQPLRTVVEGGNVGELALDHSGRLIATHNVYGVSAFDARTLKLITTGNATYPTSVTIDRNDNIYVANCGGAVTVFYPGARRVAGYIGAQYGACVVAVSPRNELYVVDGYGLIEVYRLSAKAGSVKLLRRIRDGLSDPDALAFDASGNVYVLNYPIYKGHGSVAIYRPGEASPKRTLRRGIDLPFALAVDSHGTIYVASDPQTWNRTDGWVTVYGATGDSPVGRIKKGINAPMALAIDPEDNVYVGNIYDDDVTVYSPGLELLRTIRHGVVDPYALSIGD